MKFYYISAEGRGLLDASSIACDPRRIFPNRLSTPRHASAPSRRSPTDCSRSCARTRAASPIWSMPSARWQARG